MEPRTLLHNHKSRLSDSLRAAAADRQNEHAWLPVRRPANEGTRDISQLFGRQLGKQYLEMRRCVRAGAVASQILGTMCSGVGRNRPKLTPPPAPSPQPSLRTKPKDEGWTRGVNAERNRRSSEKRWHLEWHDVWGGGANGRLPRESRREGECPSVCV